MEIKIDTKKDSPEDIRKTIEFLKTLIDASSRSSSEFNASSDAASGMANIFGDTPVLSNEPIKSSGNEEEEEEKEKIELIPY